MPPRAKDRYRHPDTQNAITTWVPDNLLARVDAQLSVKTAGQIGIKPSRQAWILELMRRELAADKAPA